MRCTSLVVVSLFAVLAASWQNFTVGVPNQFLLDGKPFRILSSNFHYFRCPRALWEDRLLRLKALGINAIEMYTPWNYHEMTQGEFDFSGEKDLGAFLSLVKSLDLVVLLRPGPYVCAEWEFGGFPWWMLRTGNVQIRTFNSSYIKLVVDWWTALFEIVSPHLVEKGGPIVMAQMENEFGSFGDCENNDNDRMYMEFLVEFARENLSKTLVLYTTDPFQNMKKGSLPGSVVLTLPDFGPGTDSSSQWSLQEAMNPPGLSPRISTEFYTGWISSWGKPMANTSSTAVAAWLENLLSQNASVSLYMGFGGSNFGFWNGANVDTPQSAVVPQIQSYDYDAPVSENGVHGYGSDGVDKFVAVQKVLQKYQSHSVPAEPAFIPVFVPESVTANRSVGLFDVLEWFRATQLPTDPVFMERLGQGYGYVLYLHESGNGVPAGTLQLPQLSDRVHVFANKTLLAVLEHGQTPSCQIPNHTEALA